MQARGSPSASRKSSRSTSFAAGFWMCGARVSRRRVLGFSIVTLCAPIGCAAREALAKSAALRYRKRSQVFRSLPARLPLRRAVFYGVMVGSLSAIANSGSAMAWAKSSRIAARIMLPHLSSNAARMRCAAPNQAHPASGKQPARQTGGKADHRRALLWWPRFSG